LRGDEINDINRGMNFIRSVKNIEAMEKEVYIYTNLSQADESTAK